jgi:hypothetical protein
MIDAGDGSVISGLGATNAVAFANAPLRAGATSYDPDRVNAVFVGFKITLTDKNQHERIQVFPVLIGRKNLQPGQQILVNYGKQYLPNFHRPDSHQPPPPIKTEPT